MSFLLSSNALESAVHKKLTTPAADGLDLSFSQYAPYSPMLSGSVSIVLSETIEDISVDVNVETSKSTRKRAEDWLKYSEAIVNDNVRIEQAGRVIKVQTGGLSYWQSMGARMTVKIVVTLPRHCSDITIDSHVLPLTVQSVDKAGDLVFKSSSSPISIGMIDAKSLTVKSSSGSVTFENSTEQRTDNFIHIDTSSSSITLRSTLLSPSITIDCRSGTIQATAATDTKELIVETHSGSIQADIDFMSIDKSITKMTSESGSIQLSMKNWSGVLTTQSKSGSQKVKGNVERANDGWRSGSGLCSADFKTSSGSISINVA